MEWIGTMIPTIRTFTELQNLRTFDERYDYLRLVGVVGESTFGFDRYLNQTLYTSRRWLKTRDGIIIRDDGCDLGLQDYQIKGRIIIHHMNPITMEDLELSRDIIFNPEFLVCVSHTTHLAIHFGDKSLFPKLPIVRQSGDTSPWLSNSKKEWR